MHLIFAAPASAYKKGCQFVFHGDCPGGVLLKAGTSQRLQREGGENIKAEHLMHGEVKETALMRLQV